MNYYIITAMLLFILTICFPAPDKLVLSEVLNIFVVEGLIVLSYLHQILIELKKDKK